MTTFAICSKRPYPSLVLALVVYAFVGNLNSSSAEALPESAVQLLAELESIYNLGWLTLLPPLLVVAGTMLKYPPALTMASSSVLAMFIGITLQGFDFHQSLSAAVNGFDLNMVATLGLNAPDLSRQIATLLNRGGLYSMVNTLLVIIAAFLLAAGMDVSGGLDKLLNSILNKVRGTFGLIAATMSSGSIMISLTSHGGVTALIVGGLFQKAYKEHKLAPENLSRSLEDSVTIVEPLMPWTVSAIFMATTLGVPTASYMPWATFCFTGPLFSLLWAAMFKKSKFGTKLL